MRAGKEERNSGKDGEVGRQMAEGKGADSVMEIGRRIEKHDVKEERQYNMTIICIAVKKVKKVEKEGNRKSEDEA